mgnify:CR=1 FL=1
MTLRRMRRLTFFCVSTAAFTTWLATLSTAQEEATRGVDPTLRHQLEAVIRQNQELQQQVQSLRHEVQGARDEARAAREMAEHPGGGRSGLASGRARDEQARLSRPLGGGTTFQLLDFSLDVLTSAGGSSEPDETLTLLQAGDHDPRRRGFNLSSVELSFLGAIDPWLTGEVHLLYFLDPEGESRFEIEEAFATTSQLPFGLEEHGLQVEFGHMFTEFGRSNPTHAHAWDWQDQPVIASRLFGEDGMRAPGVRAGWLLPLPWFSELHLGAQSALGETMVSFLASDEVFEERAIGGRPFADDGTRRLDDLVYLARWVNGFDISPTWSGQLGLSGLFGPNATGPDGRTIVYGADMVLKWLPLASHRGFPFVTLEAEVMGRRFMTDDFSGCPEAEEDGGCPDPIFVDDDTLDDWGGYLQALWGFRRNWSVGLRGEYAAGDGDSIGAFDSRNDDPFRDDRLRISPLLVWTPSEFSRWRLQYNYDRADFLEQDDAHTVWMGLEFLFGSHPAHGF